jgi:hypothetical protein
MHENQSTESITGNNAAPGTKARKRPYQSPTVFQLAHSHTKSGVFYDSKEDAKYGPSGTQA